ncbi:hypothetical protein BFW01_g3890 [Lasiodiplodia theobromae]|nr:hypothetical protein BFW01_g3890 [Lasiodiplodia theobromae]
MLFFLSLAYIAISIDASGLIRYLAFRVLQWGGDVGHKLFFYLYAFFFGLASFIGNDPIILSGTAFLAYMTRVSSNIKHPRAWIFSQFAVANIASAILVSSNPTNLVLAGAFNIKFIDYTANMIVPVTVTGIVLFPFLLYIIFANESLIPPKIKMHELPPEAKDKKPVNPNIPHAKGMAEEQEDDPENEETGKRLSLEEIMNPFIDKGGAAFGAVIMAATLITLLALDAASSRTGKHAVFWVTLPAAFVMFCWDIAFGWWNREETRYIARKGREEVEHAHSERERKEKDTQEHQDGTTACKPDSAEAISREVQRRSQGRAVDCIHDIEKGENAIEMVPQAADKLQDGQPKDGIQVEEREAKSGSSSEASSGTTLVEQTDEGKLPADIEDLIKHEVTPRPCEQTDKDKRPVEMEEQGKHEVISGLCEQEQGPQTLVSLIADTYRWSQETFPTATAVLGHLPFALVPFAFSMFVLVQALVTKGWVPVFAYGWYHWVSKTSTMGAIGGMGLLSVILCNFAGTNIGATILLSRVIQAWQEIHRAEGVALSNRTFWATVYSMAIGVNYGNTFMRKVSTLPV